MSKKVIAGVVLGMCLLIVWIWISSSSVSAIAQEAPTPTLMPVPDSATHELDLEMLATIDLQDYPPVPEISPRAQQIYLDGLAQGSNPHAFIKVGDCMTDNPYFLRPIGEGDYALGEYDYLQGVIDYFVDGNTDSFSRISQASAGGFNSASILDSLWANPEFCESGETPLACEVRIMQPSVALIMFGTNDVFYLDETQFDYFLRAIVVETIHNSALPVISTFPQRPEFPEKSVLYNQVIVQIALDYDIPLINLWQALESLPNQGVDPEETTHMTAPASGAVCHFLGENMQAGFTVRNLLTLQTLEAVLNAAVPES